MKVDIKDCQECKRETLQAETEITSGYDFGGTIFIKVWFCSQCGTYWRRVKHECDERVVPR